jgi:hypothetical protein
MKKWRLNFFDAAIIAVVLVAAFVFIRLQGGAGILPNAGTSATVRYIIELTNLPKEAVDRIQTGDSITDKVEKHAMGRVTDFTVEPFRVSAKDLSTGEYALHEVPDRYSARLVLEASSIVSATNITVDSGYIVRCGIEVSALGPGYGGVGYIVDIMRDDLEAK